MNTQLINYTNEDSWEISRKDFSQNKNLAFLDYSNLANILNRKTYISPFLNLITYYQLNQEVKTPILNEWIKKITVISKPIVNILLNFSKLEDNWDSYGAERVSLYTILNAIDFFMRVIDLHPNAPLPFVAPVPDGSIHFEWSTCSSELRHTIPREGELSFVYKIIKKEPGELKQYCNNVYSMDEMINIFSQWIEGVL